MIKGDEDPEKEGIIQPKTKKLTTLKKQINKGKFREEPDNGLNEGKLVVEENLEIIEEKVNSDTGEDRVETKADIKEATLQIPLM